jgi:Skp family chaperone for outer membrane proteins
MSLGVQGADERPAGRRIGLAVAAALAAALAGAQVSPAIAQTAAAGVAVYGPATPGVCLFSQVEALSKSRAGVSVDQQMKQFAQGADAELGAQRSAIMADDRALAAQRSRLQAADYDQRVAQMRRRYAELDRTRALRDAQLNQTRRDAAAQIMAVLDPSLAEAVTLRKCSVVFDRGVTLGFAAGMDITPTVIQRMDARLSYLTLQLAPPGSVRVAQ